MITQKYMASGQPSLLCALDYNNMFNMKYSKKDGYIQYTKINNYCTDVKVLKDCVLNFSVDILDSFHSNNSTTYGNETYDYERMIHKDNSCMFVKAGDIFQFNFGYWYINVIPYLLSSGHIYVDYNFENNKNYGKGNTIDRDGLLTYYTDPDDLNPSYGNAITDDVLFVKKGCQVKTDSAYDVRIFPLLSNSYCPKLFNYFAYADSNYNINITETVASSISKNFLTKTPISDTSGLYDNNIAFLITTKVDCVISVKRGNYCYIFNSNRRCEDARDEFWFGCNKYYLKAGYSIKFVVKNETTINNLPVYFPII